MYDAEDATKEITSQLNDKTQQDNGEQELPENGVLPLVSSDDARSGKDDDDDAVPTTSSKEESQQV